MTSIGKKLQKSTSGNATLDKEGIVELIQAVFIRDYQQQPNYHETRNWKGKRRD